jgi:hypothetical protein
MAENASQNGALTPRQAAFVAALLTHRRIKRAAAAVGVSERQAHRMLKLPSVQAAIAAGNDLVLSEAVAFGVSGLTRMLVVLRSIAVDTDQPPSVRVGACRAFIDGTERLREQHELTQRVAYLESRVGVANEPSPQTNAVRKR